MLPGVTDVVLEEEGVVVLETLVVLLDAGRKEVVILLVCAAIQRTAETSARRLTVDAGIEAEPSLNNVNLSGPPPMPCC